MHNPGTKIGIERLQSCHMFGQYLSPEAQKWCIEIRNNGIQKRDIGHSAAMTYWGSASGAKVISVRFSVGSFVCEAT